MYDVMVTLDSRGDIVFFDDLSNILGYNRDEVIHKNWYELFINKEDIENISNIFLKLFENGNVIEIESHRNELRTKDGKYILMNFNNSMFENKEGELFVKSNGIQHSD